MIKSFSILLTIYLEGIFSSRAKIATEIPYSYKRKDKIIKGTIPHYNLQKQPCCQKTIISAKVVEGWLNEPMPKSYKPYKSKFQNTKSWKKLEPIKKIEHYLNTISDNRPFSWIKVKE